MTPPVRGVGWDRWAKPLDSFFYLPCPFRSSSIAKHWFLLHNFLLFLLLPTHLKLPPPIPFSPTLYPSCTTYLFCSTYPSCTTCLFCPTYPSCPTYPFCPTYPSCTTYPFCPTYPSCTTYPFCPTYPSCPMYPFRPTYPFCPTYPFRPTYPSFTTYPSWPTYPFNCVLSQAPPLPLVLLHGSTNNSDEDLKKEQLQNLPTLRSGKLKD